MMMNWNLKHKTQNSKLPEEQPEFSSPWLRTWPRLYALVLGELALLVLLFYLFTRAFE